MYQNTILAKLDCLHPKLLSRHAKHRNFGHGDHLARNGEKIAKLFFPTSGLVSIVIELPDGDSIETAIVGHSGMLGGSAVIGGQLQVGTAFAQIPGAGWSLPIPELLALAQQDSKVRAAFAQNEQFLLAQGLQTAACNAKHLIKARLATWLLRAHDATGELDLRLTQEFIAEMLGCRRPSVSTIAGELQDIGAISYRRGRIRIVDQAVLRRQACDCYRTLQCIHARIVDFGRADSKYSENGQQACAVPISADGEAWSREVKR